MKPIVLPKVDGSSSQPAAEMNGVFYELTNIIDNISLEPSEGDNTQISKAISMYAAFGDFYVDSGTVNSYILSTIIVGMAFPPAAYYDGQRVRFRPQNGNTGASTLNLGSIGSKPMLKADGVSQLAPNDLIFDEDCECVYRSSADDGNGAFVLLTATVSSDLPIGSIIEYAGFAEPNKWAFCNNQELNRVTYGALFSILTFSQTGTLTVLTPTITGLATTVSMYPGMKVEGVGIQAGTKILTVDSGTQITLDQNVDGIGAQLLLFFITGSGNGSTTFNAPNISSRGTITAGTGIGLTSRIPGQTGGEETHSLTADENGEHNHESSTGGNWAIQSSGGFDVNTTSGSAWTYSNVTNMSGTGNPHNNMQPYFVVNKIIKYA